MVVTYEFDLKQKQTFSHKRENSNVKKTQLKQTYKRLIFSQG